MPGENDVYVSPSQIRRFNLKTGDIVRGSIILAVPEPMEQMPFSMSMKGVACFEDVQGFFRRNITSSTGM